MTQRQARLSINGLSYKITGIDKTTSYKDILCTIAKQHDFIKETAIKLNAKQKPRSKTTPRSVRTLPDSDSSTKRKLNQGKTICVGNDEISKVSFMKRKGKKSPTHESKTRDVAENDSDVEVYHQSRRRMKGLMKMKSKNESKQQAYNKLGRNGIETSKSNMHKNQRSYLIDDCDKISIYYLNEKLDMKIEHTGGTRQSRNGSSCTSKQQDTSSECNTIEKWPSVNIPIPDSKCADDQDSGIPSWESEEISSKDDCKIEEKRIDVKSCLADQNCYHTEVSSNPNIIQATTFQVLKMPQRKDPIKKKAIIDKKRTLADSSIVNSIYGMMKTEEAKFEREVTHNSNGSLRECVSEGDDETKENWPNSIEQENICDDVASDFEIIKMEHAESFEPNYTKNRIKVDEGFRFVQDKSFSLEQAGNCIDCRNVSIVESPKAPHEIKTKINSENRGSFILIELDDIQAECADDSPNLGLELETFLGQDLLCGEKRNASKIEAQHCDKKGLHESEATITNREQQPTRKEEELWSMEEVFSERPNTETNDTEKHSQNGIDFTHSLHHQHAIQGSRLMFIDMIDKVDGEMNCMQDRFVHTVDIDDEKLLDSKIRGKYDKKLLTWTGPTKLENVRAKEEQHKNQHKEEADFYADQHALFELRSITKSSNMTSSNTDTGCSCSIFNGKPYRNSIKFALEEDKLLVEFANKFARQLEHDFIAKFQNQLLEEDKISIGNNTVEFGSTSKVNPISERKELWKEYLNVCEQIYKITGKLFLFALKEEKSNFQLEQIKELESFHDDGSLEDDENEVIKEIVEFRTYLKKVTMTSRQNRLKLKENQLEIDRLELQLASKRSQLMSFEDLPTLNRCQNIPRKLLRNYRTKQGQSNAI